MTYSQMGHLGEPWRDSSSSSSPSDPAARSVKVILHNKTSNPWKRTYSHISHGIWAPKRVWEALSPHGLPPEQIPAGCAEAWRSESNGFMTGTEGECGYIIGSNNERVIIKWNNPFFGRNSYHISVPKGYRGHYEGGNGYNAEVIFEVSPR
jgi:hypothetical protein